MRQGGVAVIGSLGKDCPRPQGTGINLKDEVIGEVRIHEDGRFNQSLLQLQERFFTLWGPVEWGTSLSETVQVLGNFGKAPYKTSIV